MRYGCRATDGSFFDHAPMRFQNTVELAAPPDRVFSILEDPDSWPRWFDGIKRVEWTSPKPFGVGTTRTVQLTKMTVEEHFFRWEPSRRFTFYVTAQSPLPMFKALAEDYLLEPLADGRSRFTHRVGIDPRLLLRVVTPLGLAPFASMFENACAGLRTHVERS